MFSLSLTIARTTFLESVRQPIYFILVGLSAIAMVLMVAYTGFSMGFSETSEVSGDNKLLLDFGLATVFALGTLLAAFIATATMSREIENKTVMTIVSKPVPRPVLVIGKWLGVTAAQVVAVCIMLLFLLLAIRHSVLSTAADTIDGPVWAFGFGAIGLSLLVGAWGSFFYGWSFPQAATLAMLPLTFLAYVMVLLISKKWAWQPFFHDFKPQIIGACICLVLAMPVLTSIAVAASCRLGQVMTIVICFGVFVMGMLSSTVFGSRAFQNESIGTVQEATQLRSPVLLKESTMRDPGDIWLIKTQSGMNRVKAGDPFYFAASPSGVDAPVSFTPPVIPEGKDLARVEPSAFATPGLIITPVADRTLTVQTVGPTTLNIDRVPRQGDHIFLTRTKVNPAALAAWGIMPNLQFFWLLDAVNQNQPVPFTHALLVLAYSLSQVTVFLSIAVIVFQRRDVG